MKQISRHPLAQVCAALVATLCLLGNASAGDESALPAARQAGDISYRSGGIGLEESGAMKAAAGKYALSVLFVANMAGQRDVYTSPAHVTITRADNSAVLDITPDGPYLLVDLPPGKYKVSASDGQRSRTQAVQIVAGAHRYLVFAWREQERP